MTDQTLARMMELPLSQLTASAANVRKLNLDAAISDLAEDIARRGLLQSLSVRPVLTEDGAMTGMYAVAAGGRRLAALQKLVAEGRLSVDTPIPCLIKEEGIELEDSLAENVMRAGLHPLDQFRAFKALVDEENISIEEIATRFFVSPHVVRQRLKLAAASPKLLEVYAEDKLSLEQLMAFCVTGDHTRQDQVYEKIQNGYNTEPFYIRRLLTEGAVKGNDRRVLYVGAGAYEAAGGVILRDLFSDDGGGWFQDIALLDRLAQEKLAADAKSVEAEGWGWTETALQFPYGHLNGLTRLAATPAPVTVEEQARYDAALEEYNVLSEEYADAEELPEEVDQRMGELEAAMALVDERPETFASDDIGHAGVFISIEHDGRLRVERGYVKQEDRVALTRARQAAAATGEADGGETMGSGHTATGSAPDAEEVEIETATRLSDRLVAELTAHRTLALREKLAEDPDTAFLALTHALVLKSFYRFAGSDTCLEIDIRSAGLASHAPEIGETDLAERMDQRQARWAALLPQNPGDLWAALVGFDPDSLAQLFAWCVASSLNAVEMPHVRRTREFAHSNALASHVSLDMTRVWKATEKSFFAKVTKSQILATVREVKGEATAQMIDHLKKANMAAEAERLVAGSNWLPTPLRPAHDPATVNSTATSQAEPLVETTPAANDGTGSDGEEPDSVELPAFLTEALANSSGFAVAAE